MNLEGRRITVMGLGHFGGGIGAVQFLIEQGAHVTVTDLRTAEQLADSLAQIDTERVHHFVLGEHRESDFIEADMIVVSPAVRRDHALLRLARDHAVSITSEIALFWERCRGKRIAVTGTVGKSTTTMLIHQCLQAAGIKSRIGGNIGVSLLPMVDQIGEDEWIVLELSSFQLADLSRLRPAPDISVVTNFFPNHLNWHSDLDDYRQSKQAVMRWQTPDQFTVLPAHDSDIADWPTDARRITFGNADDDSGDRVTIQPDGFTIERANARSWIPVEHCSTDLHRSHQRLNVAAVVAVLSCALDLSPERYRDALRQFRNLSHRYQQIATIDGRTFINDSKATTPEATIAALLNSDQRIWLIAGGRDQGIDLSNLVATIRETVTGVALIGETASQLQEHLSPSGNLDILTASTMQQAVQWIWRRSSPGDLVLLSPGCSSDAPFANYEQRGDAFADSVAEITDQFARSSTPAGH